MKTNADVFQLEAKFCAFVLNGQNVARRVQPLYRLRYPSRPTGPYTESNKSSPHSRMLFLSGPF